MAAENYTNDVATTLSGNGGSVSALATAWLVASSVGFPAVPFRALCEGELILVTDVVGLTWTVERQQEGTTAASHADAALVRHVITAAGLANAISYAPRWDFTTVSATPYTAAPRQYVKVDTTVGAFSVVLPDATTCAGLEIAVVKISADSNLLTVLTTAGQTISGELTQEWDDPYAVMTVVSDGANWRIT